MLVDELRLELSPGFLTLAEPTPPLPGGEESPDVLLVELTRARDGHVERTALPAVPLCLHGSGLPAPRLVHGLVAYDTPAAELSFRFHDHVVHNIAVHPEGPEVRLDWQPGGSVDGIHEVTWSAEHPSGAALWFLPLYRYGDDEWRPLGLPQRETSVAVDFEELPGGEACQVRVAASDGVNTAVVDSEPFGVASKGLEPVIPAGRRGPALRRDTDRTGGTGLRP